MQFADIFDLNTIILAGPTLILVMFALVAARMGNVPSRARVVRR
jgi:hypothetical protein